MDNPTNNLNSFFRKVKYWFIFLLAIVLVLLFAKCSVIVPHSQKDIPEEPTIWVVSEVDALEYRFGHGFVFYKMVPVNPGGLNARFVWVMESKGSFNVGDKVNFQKLEKIDQD